MHNYKNVMRESIFYKYVQLLRYPCQCSILIMSGEQALSLCTAYEVPYY
jgi:hypothetical protein